MFRCLDVSRFRGFEIPRLRLKISDGIRICLRYLGAYSRALLGNDVAEDLAGELLGLIVTDDAYLDALLVAEVLMVVHLARNEHVGTLLHGIVKQEVASTTAKGYLTNRALQQLVALRALHAELLFQQFDEVASSHRLS